MDLSTWDEQFHFENFKNISDLGMIGSVQIKGLVEEYLKQWKPPVLKLRDIHVDNVGARVKFQMTFRTKGVPGPNQLEAFKLKGNIHRDPHIYSSIGDRKFYFPIDPRWITSDTAFLLFKRGRIELSGLGIIRTFEESEVIITPLILGSPNYEDDEI